MQKNAQTQTPGTVLQALLDKYDLNCNRLAKAINMSNAMVRLLVLDKSPISVAAAFRLGQFFKTKPEYWLNIQMRYDLERANNDKELAKAVSAISDVSSYSFVRKPHAAQAGQKKAAAKKAAPAPRGRKPAAKASAKADAKPAAKRGRKPAVKADAK